jgi:uncharacterized membrane protein
MLTDPAASLYEVILAIHIIGVVVAFGAMFAYPIMFTVAARQDPRGLPLLHRIEYTTERFLLNPGLLVVLAAGIYLASKGHFWSDFFVQWGLAAVVVIGASIGAVMIPTSKRAEQIATRDLAASPEHAGVAGAGVGADAAPAGEFEFSDEYRALVRRLSLVGTLLSVLVVVTIVLMALHVGA